MGQDFAFAIERTVTAMFIACPHALGLAVPLVVANLYRAGRELLTPAMGAVLMSASAVIVAINARLLRLTK